ncbi:hypothetical protein [Profundibacter sp.]
MRIFILCSLALIAYTFPAFAEIVQTIDGRSIELKDDGTYEHIETNELSDSAFVEYQDHYFILYEDRVKGRLVRFMPVFKNVSEERITGVKFTARFFNAFKEEVFIFSGNSDEPVSPNKASTYNLFYIFENNPYINGEPYDKLLPLVTNKTGNIEVTIDMIAFEGGKVVTLSE